jgi:hypothetical protein
MSLVLARAISVKKRYSKNWRDTCAKNAKFKAKQARTQAGRRHDHQHKVSANSAQRFVCMDWWQ